MRSPLRSGKLIDGEQGLSDRKCLDRTDCFLRIHPNTPFKPPNSVLHPVSSRALTWIFIRHYRTMYPMDSTMTQVNEPSTIPA